MASARLARLSPDRRRRVQQPRQLDRGARLGELGADRRGQVLDVGHLDHARLGRRLDPDRLAAQRALDPPDDDLVLAAVLGGAQELLAEVIVDRGVGAAPGRAGERHRRRPRPATPHEQLRAGAEERGLRRAAAKAEAGREQLPKRAVERRRLVGPRRLDHHLAREHHLLQLAGADSLHRLRHRLLEPPRGKHAGDPGLARRVGVGERQGRLAERGEPGAQPPRDGARIDARPGQRAQRQMGSAGGPVERQLGHHHQRGRKRRPLGRPPPSGPNANPPTQTGPAPAGSRSGSSLQTPARHLRAGGDQVAEAPGAAGDDLAGAAERGEREPVAIGLLPAEPAIAGEPRGEHRARSGPRAQPAR